VAVALVALLTGIISGMAIGGGSLLIPALVLVFSVRQQVAQGVVLLAFLPTALVAAYTHYRVGNVDLPRALCLLGGGVVGAVVGSVLAAWARAEVLRGIFGAYLLVMAAATVFLPPARSRRPDSQNSDSVTDDEDRQSRPRPK